MHNRIVTALCCYADGGGRRIKHVNSFAFFDVWFRRLINMKNRLLVILFINFFQRIIQRIKSWTIFFFFLFFLFYYNWNWNRNNSNIFAPYVRRLWLYFISGWKKIGIYHVILMSKGLIFVQIKNVIRKKRKKWDTYQGIILQGSKKQSWTTREQRHLLFDFEFVEHTFSRCLNDDK